MSRKKRRSFSDTQKADAVRECPIASELARTNAYFGWYAQAHTLRIETRPSASPNPHPRTGHSRLRLSH